MWDGAPGAYMAQATSRVQPSSFQVPAVQHYHVLPRHSNQKRPAICRGSISVYLSISVFLSLPLSLFADLTDRGLVFRSGADLLGGLTFCLDLAIHGHLE